MTSTTEANAATPPEGGVQVLGYDAAGVVEAMFCVQAMRDGVVPPTINLDDPEFPEFDLVPHRSRPAQLTAALSNSFGFGGHNASVILERAA